MIAEAKNRVFIGVPAYSRLLDVSALNNINAAGVQTVWQIEISSLLARCFNTLMCTAWNMREELGLTHFCLLHADIEITSQRWAEKMIEIMNAEKLDVLSAIVPIKQSNGDTSTALDCTEQKADVTLLCMNDFMRLPKTVTPEICVKVFGNENLLINTGVMMMRMDAVDPVRHHFHIVDEIKHVEGKYYPAGCPEDWHISRKLKRDGVRYGCTREISINHWGNMAYNNQNAYGRASEFCGISLN